VIVPSPTANLGESIMESTQNDDFDDDRQPETAMWPPKPEVLIYPKMHDEA